MSEDRTTENLDIICAELGREIAENTKEADEKMLNALLAVVEEQGPYAMALYLRAKHKDINKNIAPLMARRLARLLQKGKPKHNEAALMDLLRDIAEDLDNLLFAHEILRIALSYARYYRKAISQKGE